MPFLGDMLVPWRVTVILMGSQRLHGILKMLQCLLDSDAVQMIGQVVVVVVVVVCFVAGCSGKTYPEYHRTNPIVPFLCSERFLR